jgi:tripeptide aminopeptidase
MQNDEERDFPSVERTFAVLGPARRRLALWDPAILRMQIRLSGIAAPTGLEGRRARWVRRRFERIGFPDATLDEAGNVLAMRHGMVPGNSPVVVCAHLDTVFPAGTDLSIREDGDRLVGPGICDNGRGLAAMLAIAAILASPAVRLRRSILFSATTREEGLGDLEGAKHLFANDARHASSAIVIDGAGDERVVHRALGSRRFRIVFSGEGGHSWAAFGTPNPVHAAAIAGARLAAMSLPREPRTTLTVGRIGGGISVNAIPRDGWLEVDVRSSSQSELERAEAELRRGRWWGTLSPRARHSAADARYPRHRPPSVRLREYRPWARQAGRGCHSCRGSRTRAADGVHRRQRPDQPWNPRNCHRWRWTRRGCSYA